VVPVDVIESLTGLDFFSDLDDEMEALLERTDTCDFWTDCVEFVEIGFETCHDNGQ